MKKLLFKNWLVLMSLVMACGFTACDDDDDNVGTAPIFPEKQEINLAAGGSQEFSFEANTNWSLSSSAIWCVFVKDEVESFVLSGTPGKQTVTVKMTDDAPAHETSVAKLELTMGGEKVVIGEVRREAQGYDLQLFDEEGNPITELEVGYNDFKRFKVKANYRFAVTNKPSWVKLEGDALVGGINKEVTGGLEIIQDGNMEKYPVTADQKYTLTFASEDGKSEKQIPLVFKGMPANEIDFKLPTVNAWGWTVSLDGKTFKNTNGLNSGSTTYKNQVPFTIKALNDDFVMVYMDDWGVMDESLTWIHSTLNPSKKGEITISVNELETFPGMPAQERTGYVLVFSRTTYESIADNLDENLKDDSGNLKYEYQQNNLIMEITQEEEKQEGTADFKISAINNKGESKPVTPEKITEPTEYGTDSYYKISATGLKQIIIDPQMGEVGSEWMPSVFLGEKDITLNNDYVSISGDTLTVAPDNIKENIIVLIKDRTEKTVKVLIITPNN